MGIVIGDGSLYSKHGKRVTRLFLSNNKQPEYLYWKVDKISKYFPMKFINTHKAITTQGYHELELLRQLVYIDKKVGDKETL